MRSMVTRDAEIDFVSTRVGTQPVEYHELAGASYAIKGVFDRIAAAVALVVVAIPMAVIVAIIKLSSPGPALIKQERVGRFGRPFYFYKFRSMRVDAEVLRDTLEDHNDHDLDIPLIFKMRNDPRVTRIGSFLRRSSLDELTQLTAAAENGHQGPNGLPSIYTDIAIQGAGAAG